MTKKKMAWRLKKLPTGDEIARLVEQKVITTQEARDILFSSKDERDTESLKSEIKFLRELVDKLSTRQTIVETIREVPRYRDFGWYRPYEVWCNADVDNQLLNVASGTNSVKLTGSMADDDTLSSGGSTLASISNF